MKSTKAQTILKVVWNFLENHSRPSNWIQWACNSPCDAKVIPNHPKSTNKDVCGFKRFSFSGKHWAIQMVWWLILEIKVPRCVDMIREN